MIINCWATYQKSVIKVISFCYEASTPTHLILCIWTVAGGAISWVRGGCLDISRKKLSLHFQKTFRCNLSPSETRLWFYKQPTFGLYLLTTLLFKKSNRTALLPAQNNAQIKVKKLFTDVTWINFQQLNFQYASDNL